MSNIEFILLFSFPAVAALLIAGFVYFLARR